MPDHQRPAGVVFAATGRAVRAAAATGAVVKGPYLYAAVLGFLLALLLHTPSIAVALLVTTASGLFIYRYSLP